MKFKPAIKLTEIGDENVVCHLLDTFSGNITIIDDEFFVLTPKILKEPELLKLCPFHLYKYSIEEKMVYDRERPIIEYIGFIKSVSSYLFLSCFDNSEYQHYILSSFKGFWDVDNYPAKFCSPGVNFKVKDNYQEFTRTTIMGPDKLLSNNVDIIDLIEKDYSKRI